MRRTSKAYRPGRTPCSRNRPSESVSAHATALDAGAPALSGRKNTGVWGSGNPLILSTIRPAMAGGETVVTYSGMGRRADDGGRAHQAVPTAIADTRAKALGLRMRGVL